ncbi:beta-1,3-galactosyltransferase 1 [Austrofundulus limnaeus]|uniref:Hexosyltransferase n=1 Tax=Austrofundulus limnaeus TaxID=52670 RepID=A0A2I4CL65_AUSLI|nr:PREDICTED: beta-1,3-galactosyltransferase 1-like [Austrofundulus limnaeus]
MWRPTSGGLMKFLGASIVLLLFAHILLGLMSKDPAEGRPATPDKQQRRLRSHLPYRYVLNSAGLCRDRTPFLVFMVPVAPRQTAAREAIRKTWGAPSPDTLTLFFTGLPKVEELRPLQEELEQESRLYADIIQMDFMDSYQNLTLKTLMMMKWLGTHCPNALFAMKVDADIFVNVFHLRDLLRTSPKRGFITGSVIWDGMPRRDPSSKWYLSKELYPEDSFPPYVSGAGYVFSSDLAGQISWASTYVHLIPLEDVYVGLCLRVLGVRPVYSRSLFRNYFEIQKLEYDRCTFAQLIIVNKFKPSELLQVWPDFSKGHTNC